DKGSAGPARPPRPPPRSRNGPPPTSRQAAALPKATPPHAARKKPAHPANRAAWADAATAAISSRLGTNSLAIPAGRPFSRALSSSATISDSGFTPSVSHNREAVTRAGRDRTSRKVG